MDVTFPPDLERFIDEMVSKGEYPTREAVVLAGVARMRRGDEDSETERDRLRAMIQVGIDDLDAGRFREGEDVMRDLMARHRQRFPNVPLEGA